MNPMSEMCVQCGSELDHPDAYGEPEGPLCSEYCHELVLLYREDDDD